MKKIIFSIVIFIISITSWSFSFFWDKIPALDVKLTWFEKNEDIVFWSVLSNNKKEDKIIKVWNYLFITLQENSIFRLDDLNLWEVLSWSVVVESLFNFEVKSLNSSVNLLRSSVHIKNYLDRTKYIPIYWVSDVKYENNIVWISNNYSIIIENSKRNYSNIFSLLEKSSYKYMQTTWKTKSNLDFKQNSIFSGFWSDYYEPLIFFNDKIEKKNYFDKLTNLNECIEFLNKSNTSNWFNDEEAKSYTKTKEKCFKAEILSDDSIFDSIYNSVISVNNIKNRYDLIELLNKAKKPSYKTSLEDNAKYLSEALVQSNNNFAVLLANKISTALKSNEKFSLEALERVFIIVDAVLNTNILYIDNQYIDLRWLLEDKILQQAWNDTVLIAENLSTFHFKFFEKILSEKRYDLMDYVFEKRIFFGIEKQQLDIAKIYDDFVMKTKIIHQAYIISKMDIHWVSDKWWTIEIAEAQQTKEDRITSMIKNFVDLEPRQTNTFNYDDIKSRFSENGLVIDKDNILSHMKSWNTFTISDIKIGDSVIMLDYDYLDDAVYNIKIINSDSCDAIEWSLSLRGLKRMMASKLEPEYIDTSIASIFGSAPKKKEFSYDWLLEKELVRKYLESIEIAVNVEDIIKENGNVFNIKKASVLYKWEQNIDFSFNITLEDWRVSNVKMLADDKQQMFTNVSYAKNLWWIVKKTFDIMEARSENKSKMLIDLTDFAIKDNDIKIDSLSKDWFSIIWMWLDKVWTWEINWTYYAEKELFSTVAYRLNDINVAWTWWITLFAFKSSVSDITSQAIEKLEKEASRKSEFLRRLIDYMNIPDELINWDWIWK